jgi:hypothetical protein
MQIKSRYFRLPCGDAGSLVPMLLLCFLILALLVGGFTAASSAFLAQRDLQATCDDATTYAAGAVDPDVPSNSEGLLVATAAAKERVDAFVARRVSDDPTLTMRVEVNAEVLTLSCRRKAKIAFGGLVGRGDGIERSTESSVRSPLKAPAPAAS